MDHIHKKLCFDVEKFPGMGAKIGHAFHILSTTKKKFLLVFIRVSTDLQKK
jgi:hypothetical protein